MKLQQLGPYRIVKQIGKGGMGAVYEAVSKGEVSKGAVSGEAADEQAAPDASTRVAIKALNPQLAMMDGFRERFEAEIESLKKLNHAGIVRLYGYGEQDGILFYSMELVEGPSLEQEIRRGRRFDWHETLRIGIETCRALKHAHDHGVVHRDIKPGNLMLTADQQVKIADFGIARLFGGTQLTTAGGVLGTADYMSPEQADGRAVTEKCDQYSLGGVLYALLAGRPPFRAKTLPEMLQLQRYAEPEPVRHFASETPAQLDRLIGQLLSKDPAERFPNVLVLCRHMEAMEKALSRPDQAREPAAAEPLGETLAPDSTVAESQPPLEAPVVFPQETSPGVADLHNAPTLAQPTESSTLPGVAPPIESSATGTTLTRTATHFTTVDEETRRQQQQNQGNRLALVAQLSGLMAMLGLLLWGGWQLMKPPTADALLMRIYQAIQAEGVQELSRESASQVESFLARFPDDPRAQELLPLQEQLEFQKYERQARAQARFSGAAGFKPIEKIYFEAIALTEDQPSETLALLEALLDLYDPADDVVSFQAAKALAARYQTLGDPRLLVVARQRIGQLHQQQTEAAKRERPMLTKRLARAAQLESAHPHQALEMYRAMVKLYGNQAWAHDVVLQAQAASERLADELDSPQ
jgi:serine/threonine-protein kinase